jgi:CRISPR-associated protein Cmr6
MKSFENIGLFYQKYYFRGVDFSQVDFKNNSKTIIKECNQTLLGFKKLNNNYFFHAKDDSKFPLKNSYPGIVTGIGMKHETGIEGELKLGLYFDYTCGMPCIPGASIKGALRSAFPQTVKHSSTTLKVKYAKAFIINEMLNEIAPEIFPKIDPKDKNNFEDIFSKINLIEREIFDGEKVYIKKNDVAETQKDYLSVYQRDIFHDAFIVKGDSKDRILAEDSITNHPHPLKNPNPVIFLKIIPGVTIQFNFDLKDGIYLNANQKIELFKKIVKYYGIGAKTNVGYGQFVNV